MWGTTGRAPKQPTSSVASPSRRSPQLSGVPLCLAAALTAVVMFPARPAQAQCAVCGNPAFAVGDNDLRRTFLPDAPRRLRLTASLLYVSQTYRDIYQGSDRLSDIDKSGVMFTPDWQLRTHVATLVMGAELATGSQLEVTLPYAVASATRLADAGQGDAIDGGGNPIATHADHGFSDVELRFRQRLAPLLGRRLLGLGLRDVVLSLGGVAPTGHFIAKDPNGVEPTAYASLGRGVWWATLDLEVLGAIGPRIGWIVGSSARLPLTTITNQGFLFRWGTEVRSHATATAVVLPRWLAVSLGAEWLWRGAGEERLFAGLPIDAFPNGGGRWLTLVPGLRVPLPAGLALHAAVRVPLWRTVGGLQPTAGFGWTVGIAGQFSANNDAG